MEDDNIEQKVSNKLRELRRARGLTVQELAKGVGENYQKVGRIERGKTQPSLEYLVKASGALDFSLDSLFDEMTKPKETAGQDVLLLEKIIGFLEENSDKLDLSSPQKKAVLTSRIYEMCSALPKDAVDKFLQSLLDLVPLLGA